MIRPRSPEIAMLLSLDPPQLKRKKETRGRIYIIILSALLSVTFHYRRIRRFRPRGKQLSGNMFFDVARTHWCTWCRNDAVVPAYKNLPLYFLSRLCSPFATVGTFHMQTSRRECVKRTKAGDSLVITAISLLQIVM